MPLRPQRNARRIGVKDVVENGEAIFDIPNVHHIRSIGVVLSGTLTIASAVSTATPAHSPAGLIKRVDLIANGKDVLEQVPFEIAAFGNYQREFLSEVTVPGVSVAAHPFRAVGWYDRINVDGPRPKDSAFKAAIHARDLFQLRVSFGAKTDISTNPSAANLTLSNATVGVLVESLVEKDGQTDEPKLIKKRTLQTFQVTAANSNLRVSLPRGNRIRLLEVLALDDGAPDNDLVNNLELSLDGIDVRHNLSYDDTRSANKIDKRLAGDVPTGFAVVDSSAEGKTSEFYETAGRALAELVIDHNAPGGALGTIHVVTEEFLPPQ